MPPGQDSVKVLAVTAQPGAEDTGVQVSVEVAVTRFVLVHEADTVPDGVAEVSTSGFGTVVTVKADPGVTLDCTQLMV